MIGFLVGFLFGLWLTVGFFLLFVAPGRRVDDGYDPLASDSSSRLWLSAVVVVLALVAAAWADGSVL